ncbi:MAG: hypothetical protein D6722_14860 [Bacteroidetes bacterium]|nr:MAG: hypothetical protein D6722_14860 [Bacteroidota bacterium]
MAAGFRLPEGPWQFLPRPYISSPTAITTSDFSSRYIKIHCYNDGTQSNSSYIELKGIKGFYHNGGWSVNYMGANR